jgi:hypothetical protein
LRQSGRLPRFRQNGRYQEHREKHVPSVKHDSRKLLQNIQKLKLGSFIICLQCFRMVVAEKIHCGIEAREWIQSAVPRLSLAFRSRSASRRLSLNYKGIESIGVSRFLRKLADLEPLRARLLPEPAFSDPSPAPQLRQNRIKRASLQADQYGATTTAQFGFHHWMIGCSPVVVGLAIAKERKPMRSQCRIVTH